MGVLLSELHYLDNKESINSSCPGLDLCNKPLHVRPSVLIGARSTNHPYYKNFQVNLNSLELPPYKSFDAFEISRSPSSAETGPPLRHAVTLHN